MDGYRRFPKDEEFKREFMDKDIYSFRNRNYLLSKLENYNRKEPVNVASYTIEHIMPQNPNLSSEWREELGIYWGKIHEEYLNTIGNLTLTGYNPELSDKPFRDKRDMKSGFKDSPLRLNHSLASLEHWNRNEIETRAEYLANKAIEIWAFPVLSSSSIAYREKARHSYGKIEYTLADHNDLQGDIRELFEQLRKRILNIDASVKEEIKKQYIAYKTTTNFVDIVPQKTALRLSLNMRFDQINDPKGICRDVTNLGRWGNGDVEVKLSSPYQINDVMDLIYQSYTLHSENAVE